MCFKLLVFVIDQLKRHASTNVRDSARLVLTDKLWYVMEESNES